MGACASSIKKEESICPKDLTPNFGESSFFAKLNSSKKRNKNDESLIFAKDDNHDRSQQHADKTKSSEALFFGIFSSSKKKEKIKNDGISKVSPDHIPESTKNARCYGLNFSKKE